MKALAVVESGKQIVFAVESEFSGSYAVSVSSDCSSKKAFSFIVDIPVDILITEYDIIHIAQTIGGKQCHYTASEICDLHGKSVTVGQGVQINRFTVNRSIKIGLIDERQPSFRTC